MVAPPSRMFSCPGPSSDAFKRFALCFQIGLSVVVDGVEADVAEPASDHCDLNAGRDQMYRGRMLEAVRRDVLRRQARHFLGGSRDALRELEAYARGTEWRTIPVDVVARGPGTVAKWDLRHIREFTASRPELRANLLRIVSIDLAAKLRDVLSGEVADIV